MLLAGLIATCSCASRIPAPRVSVESVQTTAAATPATSAELEDLIDVVTRSCAELLFDGIMLGKVSGYNPPDRVRTELRALVQDCQTSARTMDLVRKALAIEEDYFTRHENSAVLLMHILVLSDSYYGSESSELRKQVWKQLVADTEYQWQFGRFELYERDVSRLLAAEHR